MKYNRATALPIILFLYTTAMAAYFLPKQHGTRTQSIVTLVVAYGIIVLLWFTLRKKQQMAKRREKDIESRKQ